MNIRKATVNDHCDIMKIILKAQEYLKISGVNQWQNGYPSSAIILNDIENENAYVLVDNGRIIATQTIIFNCEPTYDRIFDGKWLSNEAFIVIHRMAVDRNFMKNGIASLMFQNVESIAMNSGIRSIKVDTHEKNLSMRKTLEKNGYTYCGLIFLTDGNPRVAYEKLLF